MGTVHVSKSSTERPGGLPSPTLSEQARRLRDLLVDEAIDQLTGMT
jgi:hypothetical protein